ncbi:MULTISPECIES: DUF3575 domain-containing protein [Myroides]|uniref:DUF3575 domain-containing protein n=1 Tax=Myroides albus TaxID=2562892 RepID=A0A6I3LI52_9FLAO|nr:MULTISPECIES: DUF3575 domain-containing protein [Myroides]MTG97933.1 DUF3575 domain-containing protein [Myroides albus]MVX36398.1 DUF3575 domain-containing protein [Myroides sp. LoEW2-1]UVD81121.1 DUF3575 domain-containing protein [Myroides albus]
MKKLFLGLMFLACTFGAKAQALNEVKINVLNTLVLASVELGYEHFIDHNQSIGANFNINDRFSYHAEKNSKNQKFKTNSLMVNYNYYFGGKTGANGSGYVVTPFLKYRFGNFEEDKWNEIDAVDQTVKVDMDSFIFGVGVGYKWALGDSFTINPFANIARNFSSEVNDRFSAIEFNAGINIGYRF